MRERERQIPYHFDVVVPDNLQKLAYITRDNFELKNDTKVSGNCEKAAVNYVHNLMRGYDGRLFNMMDNVFILRAHTQEEDKFIIPEWKFDSGAILQVNKQFFGVFFGLDREKEIIRATKMGELMNSINKQTPGPWPEATKVQRLIEAGIRKPKLVSEFMAIPIVQSKNGRVTLQQELQSLTHS